MNEMI